MILPPLAPAVHRRLLPNGVTLLVLPTGGPAAAVAVRVNAGFLDEPDAVVGVSHVLEHMVFKGAGALAPGALARRIKAVGGSVNAFTSYDATQYWATVPPDGLSEVARLLALAVQAPRVDPEELQRELGVIAEEVRRKRDTPGAMAQETLHALLYRAHRIRRWRIGEEAAIQAFRREDVAGFHAAHYLPARTVVAVAGGVAADATLACLESAWAGWAGAGLARDTGPAEPPDSPSGHQALSGDTAVVELRVGWRIPGPLHPDADALGMVAALLGLGRGARLWRSLRTPGLATGVSAGTLTAGDVGVFTLGATVPPPRLTEVAAPLAAEMAALREAGPSATELERARAMLLARHARARESAVSLAGALAAAESLRDLALLDEAVAHLRAMTGEAVREVARRWLGEEGVSATTFGPQSVPPFDLAELRGGRAAAPAAAPLADLPAPVRPPRAGAPPDSAPRHLPLDGGDLLWWPRAGAGLATVGCYVTCPAPERPAEAGLGALALRTALRGAGGLDAEGLALAFERLGGSARPALGHDLAGVATTVLAEGALEAATWLAAILDRPRLAEADIDRERALLVAEAATARDDMWRRPHRLALAAAWGDAGYGLPLGGTEDTLATLGPRRVRECHQDLLGGPRTVVVAGEVDEPTAVMLARLLLAAAVPARVAAHGPAWGQWCGPVERIESRVRHQTAFAVAYPGPGRRARERHAAEVWAALAGGLGGRLFESLRSARSLAYTVHAGASAWRHGGTITAYLATAPEREAEARAALAAEMEGFRAAPPSPEEVTRAARFLAGQARMARERTAALAGELLDAWLLGEGLDELRAPWERYLEVTPAAVHAVAGVFDPAQAAVGVVRGG